MGSILGPVLREKTAVDAVMLRRTRVKLDITGLPFTSFKIKAEL